MIAVKDAADHQYVCMKIEVAMDSALMSVMSEFNKSIYDRFGIMLVDPSYKSDTADIENTKEHFMIYLTGNLRGMDGEGLGSRIEAKHTDITEAKGALEDGADSISRQVAKYTDKRMNEGYATERYAAEQPPKEVSDRISDADNLEDIKERMDMSVSIIEAGYGSIPPYIREIRENMEYAGRYIAEMSGCHATEVISYEMESRGISYQNESFGIQNRVCDYASDEGNRDMWIIYLMNTLKCIADTDGEARGELEYILFGSEYEYENAAKMCEILMSLFMHSYVDEVRSGSSISDEAEDYARRYVEEHYYENYEGESFAELRNLYICAKAYESSYEKCTSLIRGGSESMAGGFAAMSYRDYIAAALINGDDDEQLARFLDVVDSYAIQSGNPGCRVDKCIVGICAEADLTYKDREYEIEREYEYD